MGSSNVVEYLTCNYSFFITCTYIHLTIMISTSKKNIWCPSGHGTWAHTIFDIYIYKYIYIYIISTI